MYNAGLVFFSFIIELPYQELRVINFSSVVNCGAAE